MNPKKASVLFGMELGIIYDFQNIQEVTLKNSKWAPLYWLIRIQILDFLIAKAFFIILFFILIKFVWKCALWLSFFLILFYVH